MFRMSTKWKERFTIAFSAVLANCREYMGKPVTDFGVNAYTDSIKKEKGAPL